MHYPVLSDIVVIFALAAVVLFLFHRIRIPPIIGFLFTGVIAGPGGIGAVTEVAAVEVLAEVGVILLMFTIGLEFSIRDFLRMKKAVLGGGGLQVSLSTVATMLICIAMGLPLSLGVFAGFLVALSSTAIVLKQLQSSAQIESPHGRLTLGTLIFQDVIIVPMMLLTPILAGSSGDAVGTELLMLLVKGIGIIALVVIAARYVIPPILQRVVGTRITELFFLSIVALCFLVAWLTSSIGLSLALGAFLAGMIIADSDYALHALGNVLPFRDLFTSFFFVSVGMLLEPSFIFANPITVVGLTLAVIVGKTLLATVAALLLRYPLRTALLMGIALSQIGEFSFILSRVGIANGLFTNDVYQMFLSVSVLTMAATPVLIQIAPRIAMKLGVRTPVYGEGEDAVEPGEHLTGEELFIIGFGLNGRNLYHAADAEGIPVSILEMNFDTVRHEQARGIPIQFGDAAHDAVLLHAGLLRARVVVIAISDPAATARITQRIRQIHPSAHVIARTRFVSEVPRLYGLGAHEVIPEEFETSVEIFKRTLRSLAVNESEIQKKIAHLREDCYAFLREDDENAAPTQAS
ncbi:MAG: cation:proton antiporter [Bacteroidetes bacterium]|nr:cation:proton antiporter [Bacteroidota bacterium]